jgi:glycine reductase
MGPAVTGMFPENPGVDLFKKFIYIIATKSSPLGMQEAAEKMVAFGIKLAKQESIESPQAEGYIPRCIRKNYFATKTGAERAVDMLLQKMDEQPFFTEYPMPVFDRVPPLPPITNLNQITLALISSGGIVPRGNPDRIESSGASRFGKYDISKCQRLDSETHEAVHGG